MPRFELWDPFEEFRRMGRMMDKAFRGFSSLTPIREPLIDVIDKGKEVQVLAELPGIEKKDINLHVTEDSVSIEAESKQAVEKSDKDKGYYYHERTYQSFSRRIPLPTEVMPEKANAEFKNGILEITLPKKHPEEQKGKGFRIEIK